MQAAHTCTVHTPADRQTDWVCIKEYTKVHFFLINTDAWKRGKTEENCHIQYSMPKEKKWDKGKG